MNNIISNIISHYYGFIQINAALVSISDYFQKH